MEKLKINILSSYYSKAFNDVCELITGAGHEIVSSGNPDLIICPDYDRIIPDGVIKSSRYGALVFHPSPLPRMRGRDAIKRQYAAGDKVGGGTWFWANSGPDSGNICEQECCIIDTSLRPRDYYEQVIIPIMTRSLSRALEGIAAGRVRSVPQILKYKKQ